jgi:hypothetical protein
VFGPLRHHLSPALCRPARSNETAPAFSIENARDVKNADGETFFWKR